MGLLLMTGCISNPVIPPDMSPPSGYYSVGDPTLAPSDARAITVANDFMEKTFNEGGNAYYRPRKIETGYDVDVIHAVKNDKGETRYNDFSTSVRISADWQKVDCIRW